MRKPMFFGLFAQPPHWLHVMVAILPFVISIMLYQGVSSHRNEISRNGIDKMTPRITKMIKTTKALAFEKGRKGHYRLWNDTYHSLKRMVLGLSCASAFALLLGVNMGVLPGVRAMILPFLTFFTSIPMLAILPILIITFKVGELSKVVLIFLGTFGAMTRDICFYVEKLPEEFRTKALTLNAGQFDYVYRVVLPQVMPRMIENIRLQLGAAWLFLIASESTGARAGLGYRIFISIRNTGMDTIIPYVLWMTLIAFLIDFAFSRGNRKLFNWYFLDSR